MASITMTEEFLFLKKQISAALGMQIDRPGTIEHQGAPS
jgi:hypothetical protein